MLMLSIFSGMPTVCTLVTPYNACSPGPSPSPSPDPGPDPDPDPNPDLQCAST